MADIKQIQFKRSNVPGKIPTTAQLVEGEIGINLRDRTIFTKNDLGQIVDIGFGKGGAVVGNITQTGGNITTTGNITANGILTANNYVTTKWLRAQNTVTAASQGASIGWNKISGQGKTDFMNFRGSNNGGFSFWNGQTLDDTVVIAEITSTGDFTGNGIVLEKDATIKGNAVISGEVTYKNQTLDNRFVSRAGDTMTGALTSSADITTTKAVEAYRINSGSRFSVYNTSSASIDLVNPSVDTLTTLPTANKFLGYMRFSEGSKTNDVAGGVSRVGFQAYIPANTSGVKALWDTRDNETNVKTRIHMDSDSGVTRIDIGSFQAGTTTLGATTLTNLTANGSITSAGTITVSNTNALALTHANASIEMGSLTAAGSPYIDFHTSGTNVDYDIRLIADASSLSVMSRTAVLEDFNLKSIRNLRMNDTSSSSIIMCRGATILRDHGNGNVTISASKKSDTDTVGGDLYLGYNSGSANVTNTVRLEAPLWWKGTTQLVSSAGKLIGASLDTAYLPLTGGAMTGALTSNSDITSTKVIEGQQVRSTYRMGISRNTTPYFDFIRTDVITADALPTTNQTLGMIRFNEGSKTTDIHGGTVRGQINHQIITDGSGQFVIDNRDQAGVVKNRIRMYTSDGSTRVDVGSFVAGTTTLGTTTTGELTSTGALSVSMAAPNLQLRAANTDTRQYVMAYKNNGVNSWYVGKANGNSEGLALWNYDGACGVTIQPDGNVQILTGGGGETTFNKTGMIYINRTPTGSDQALIRGTVEPGGHADWRGRGAGLQVDCPASNTSAYNIWKATQWNRDHIAAMDVHMPTDSNSTVVRLITGGAIYYFYGNGDVSGVNNFTANANGYFNDVYIRSDERLKRNLVKLNSALDKVDQLNGYSYEKRMSLESEEYNTKEVGLIAQELQTVLPDAVSEGKDDLLKISPSAVNALLVEAIKELRREVNELKSQINKGA